MIARTWRGATRAEDADAYVAYLHETGLRDYRATPGNRGVLALRRLVDAPGGRRAEFLLISLWDDMDAVRAFAGDPPERAVFYPADDAFLLARDTVVDHFAVVFDGRDAAP